VIKAIDGQSVKDPSELSSAIDGKKPGDKITIQIQRNGLTQEVDATLGVRPKHP
jgi:putative serine protease PepD